MWRQKLYVLFNKIIKRLHFKVIIIQDSMLTDDEGITFRLFFDWSE